MERPRQWRHLCIDMQRLFSEATPWQVSWMAQIEPAVYEVASRYAERTIFTRFMPPEHPDQMRGTWREYYRKWREMTRERLPSDMTKLLPALAALAPPARILDKMTYSPWINGALDDHLRANGVDMLVITGGETDVCVLSAVLGAIDLGYRVVLLTDAVCSSVDETHDASLKLFADRFSVQLELMDTEKFLKVAQSDFRYDT